MLRIVWRQVKADARLRGNGGMQQAMAHTLWLSVTPSVCLSVSRHYPPMFTPSSRCDGSLYRLCHATPKGVRLLPPAACARVSCSLFSCLSMASSCAAILPPPNFPLLQMWRLPVTLSVRHGPLTSLSAFAMSSGVSTRFSLNPPCFSWRLVAEFRRALHILSSQAVGRSQGGECEGLR